MKFSVDGLYHISRERFWSSVFFERAYNEGLYLHGLNFHRFEILEDATVADGRRERLIKVYPKIDLPRALKRLVGEGVHYFEAGQFNHETQRWHTKIEVPKLGQKLSIESTMWLEDNGPERAVRHAEFEVNARIIGLGRILSTFVKKTLIESYEQARVFTNDWLRKQI